MGNDGIGVLFILLYGICVYAAENVTNLGKPLSIPASQYWDGDDGPWSTFRIEIGGRQQERQQFRVLPGSSQSSTMLVLPEACPSTGMSLEDCEKLHGGLFMRNESQTWSLIGQYELNTYLEGRVGYSGSGLYGRDVLSLGWTGDGLPSLENQVISGVIAENLTLGSLAMNPRPTNFTNFNDPMPSLLQNLHTLNDTPIPSVSWSYTAGAFNAVPKVFGSLVLGGYDSTRFVPNNIIFPFGADISLDFQVALQRITFNSNGSLSDLLTGPIVSYITTLVPDIWLPESVCLSFVRAFNLQFDRAGNTFFIDGTGHEMNLNNNPIVTFHIGPGFSGGNVSINMPYSNFQLAFKASDRNLSTGAIYRFPIRRASDNSEYVLGRAFLQSAYLSADYERNIFNLSQAIYPSSATKANIVPILPVDMIQVNPGTDSGNSSNKLSTGVIAGIAVGGAGGLALIVGIAFLLHRRKKDKKAKSHELEDTDVQNFASHEVDGDGRRHELGGGLKHELVGDMSPKVELYASEEQEKPAEIADTQIEVYELPANEKKHVELEGEGHLKELSSTTR
ncbi:acid protease [Pyrenochaeta sp. DS3sAY3a]|nr:acid protease [Pyrenochaeta sp. DS3sAY3a]